MVSSPSLVILSHFPYYGSSLTCPWFIPLSSFFQRCFWMSWSILMPFTSTKPRLLTLAYITLDSRSGCLLGKYRQIPHWQEELLTFTIAGAGCLSSSHLPSQQMGVPPPLSFKRTWRTTVHMLIFLKSHPLVPLTGFSYFKPLFFFLSKDSAFLPFSSMK